MIKTNILTKYYGKDVLGIKNVNLDVQKGEVFGFIGPNGAGKSTTVRTLLNFIFPTSGGGRVNGFDIVSDSVNVRGSIGYIPSEVFFYGDMTVQNFLDYAASFSSTDYKEKQTELIKLLDLDSSRKIEDLSFGNKKKVAIVQALQSSPDILILDEPTSGLDPLMQNVFFKILNNEKQNGTTIFFSTHILSEVQRACDRVGIIKNGELIKVETLDEIKKTSARRIRVITDDKIKANNEMMEFEQIENDATFLYSGNVKDLFRFLLEYNIQDISITEPDLEEIFMHYYELEE